jgi:hypothetical protein
LNHARRPLIERLGWPRIPASATALADLVRFLGREVEEARAEAAASGEFCWQPESDSLGGRLLLPRAALGERLSAAFRNVLPPAGAAIHPAAPKSSPLFDAAMTRIGISGFYSPFTGEALVNRAMPDPAQPFTMAHEMAHQRGIAREDEANFLAWMVCRVSGSPAARYSASLAAFRHAWRALAGAAPDTAAALSHSVIGPEAAGDLRAMRIFWHRHEGSTTRVAERTNDIYLRVSGDAAGVSSYGRMIELLLAYRASHPQLAGARK